MGKQQTPTDCDVLVLPGPVVAPATAPRTRFTTPGASGCAAHVLSRQFKGFSLSAVSRPQSRQIAEYNRVLNPVGVLLCDCLNHTNP